MATLLFRTCRQYFIQSAGTARFFAIRYRMRGGREVQELPVHMQPIENDSAIAGWTDRVHFGAVV
jgi:hypothetical protein